MLARNLEIVQAFFDAWNRGAWDEALEGASPDVEFDMSANAGEWRGVHVGTDQVKRMFDRFVEPWESVRLDLHKCIDAGDRAVTHHSGHFVGRDGIRAEVQAGWGWTFHDGLLTRVVAYHDPDEALATVEPREPQKIEIIRAALDAWNRGDWDGALKDATPDFEFDNSTVTGEWHGVHKGPDEVKRMWATFAEPWESVEIEIDEVIDESEHAVITMQTAVFEGRDRLRVAARAAWCWSFRDGALARVVSANELDEVLVAAGLRDK